MNLKFMRSVTERARAIRQFIIVKNKLMSLFNEAYEISRALEKLELLLAIASSNFITRYSCFEKGCPTKAYATMPKGITGNGVLSP